MVNSHVVKMILETCQLLSTAHRLLDGVQYEGKTETGRSVKRWRLDDSRETVLYSATHINHPSAVWCRQTNNNYNWLYAHLCGLMIEYTHRYGKQHKCNALSPHLAELPRNIPIGNFTPPTPAMDASYLVGKDSLASYRNYYKNGKTHLHKYTNREPPEWLTQ
jgi:hypothetical protein